MDDIENYPTMEKIQKSQSECPELKKVIDCLNKGKEIEAGPYKQYTNLSIKDGLLCKGLRIIVPDEWQEPVVRELHGQHHVGAPNKLELCRNPVQDSSETVRLSPRTLFGPPKSPGE